jgi:hypothetical protein
MMARTLDPIAPPPAIVEQQKLSTYICSACDGARDCNCVAPALERLAAIREQSRQRTRRAREKAQQDQQSCSASEPADEPPYCPQPPAREKTTKPDLPRPPKLKSDPLKEAADHKAAILALLPQMRRIEREQFEAALLEEVEQLNAKLRVRKCQDGKALGADDLHWWSMRRNAGRSGVTTSRKERNHLAKWSEPKLDVADRWLAKHDKGFKQRRSTSEN